MSVSCASQQHAPALAAIHQAAFTAREAWGADAIRLQLALPGAFGLIDDDGGMILARVAGGEAEILTFAVLPERRRRGIGTRLLHVAITRAASMGAEALYLEVSTENQAALACYAAAGFSQVGRRQRYYADGTDALVLRSALAGEARDE